MSQSNNIEIIYDGECPVCTRYVTMLRLRESIGNVVLTNVRENIERAEQFKKSGYDLDDGMLVIINDEVHYGQQAVHILSLLSTPSTLFNKVNSFIFKRKWLAKSLYPILVLLRKFLLKLIGRKKIFDK